MPASLGAVRLENILENILEKCSWPPWSTAGYLETGDILR